MKLKKYGYKITDMPRVRHQCLGKAVKSNGYNKVLNALYSRKSDSNGYKFNRYRADINWLKQRR